MHFDKAGDTKACFFILTFPVVAGLGSVQQSVSHIKIVRLTETCSLRRLLRENFCSCSGSHHLGCTQQKKQKNNHAALHCACICIRTHSWYARDKLLCRRWHYWTSKQLLFICGDGLHRRRWLCRRGFALAALCILYPENVAIGR